jgi:hypothetical protein
MGIYRMLFLILSVSLVQSICLLLKNAVERLKKKGFGHSEEWTIEPSLELKKEKSCAVAIPAAFIWMYILIRMETTIVKIKFIIKTCFYVVKIIS